MNDDVCRVTSRVTVCQIQYRYYYTPEYRTPEYVVVRYISMKGRIPRGPQNTVSIERVLYRT